MKMQTPPPLSPALETLLAPHRTMLPLAPSVEARALARAVALAQASPLDRWGTESRSREPAPIRVFGAPRWVFAAAASVFPIPDCGALFWLSGFALTPVLVCAAVLAAGFGPGSTSFSCSA